MRSRLARTGDELPFSYDRRKVHVVFSLREDFLPELEGLRGRVNAIYAMTFMGMAPVGALLAGIAARALDGVAAHLAVILLPDPAAAGDVG